MIPGEMQLGEMQHFIIRHWRDATWRDATWRGATPPYKLYSTILLIINIIQGFEAYDHTINYKFVDVMWLIK